MMTVCNDTGHDFRVIAQCPAYVQGSLELPGDLDVKIQVSRG